MSIDAIALGKGCDSLVACFHGKKYTAISKNVVGENDECRLSNGGCTTEKKCGY